MQGSLPRLMVMSGLAGLSSAGILASINAAAQAAGEGKSAVWSALLFTVALLIWIKTQNYILITATIEIQAIIHKVRVRLMDQVRRSELIPLDAIGRARIVGAITRDTSILAQAANMLAFGAQGAIVLVFVALYVAYLSLLAFALSVAIIGLAAALFHSKSRQLTAGQREAAERENRLFERSTDLLEGFKEVRLNRARSEDLFDDVVEVSRTAANVKIHTESETFKRLIFSQSSMYVLLGAIVFIVPLVSESAADSITKTTTAVLFAVGTCFGLVQSIPILSAANVAADSIERLEAELRATVVSPIMSAREPARRFEKIEMRDIVFRYVDRLSDVAFQIGPLSFTLHSGDLVFVTGGNGSGKSTFMRVLAGLYEPTAGEVLLDGMRIVDSNREMYRELIAAIFTDYHLFQRLYGIPDPDVAEVNRLLTQFRLIDKTSLTDREFRTLDLSGGQRKRLGLIVSLLEKRPILLLDEWTADQDPEFRRRFYHELLPALNQAGVTVVAITHDDRYLDELHLPARRVRMDEGRFVEQQAAERA